MNLSLRKKLLLLVLLPFVLFGVFTFDKISSEKSRLKDMELILGKMNQLEIISGLTHELQKERDFAVKFLVNPLLSAETQLTNQLLVTDSLISIYTDLVNKNSLDSSSLKVLNEFQEVRASLTGYSYGPDEVNIAYNKLIKHYLNIVAEVGSEINTPNTKEEMKAYLALAESKESLGKIRNLINKALVFGMFQQLEYGMFSGYKGAFEYNLNLFMKHSPENFKSRFKMDLEGGTMLNTIQIIDYCFESSTSSLSDYTPTDWWISSTGTINLLHEQELFVLGSIKQSLSKESTILQQEISSLYVMLSCVLAGLLLLVALIAKSITKPLKKIEIVAQKLKQGKTDVNVEIHQNDEIGRLAKVFNEMAENADKMAFVAQKIGEGDYDVNINKRSEGDVFGDALINMRNNLREKTSDLKNKIAELKESNKYKSEFVANMSHELRTPLNSMLILASLLQENQEDNLTEEQKEYINVIHQSGSNLLELINDILDLSKIEAGKLSVEVSEMNLFKLLNDIYGLFKPVALENGLKFSVESQSLLPEIIECDPLRLGQIIKNLISNALKFTPSGGVVTLEVNYKDEELIFRVKDSGVGIPEDKLESIFGAFNQVDGSTSRNYGGTGLGLSITANLVSLLNGEISVKSALNEGSEFIVELPCEIQKASLKPLTDFNITVPKNNDRKPKVPLRSEKENDKVEVIKPVPDNNKAPKVLLVDDDISNVFLLAGEFNQYNWVDASTKEEVIEKIKLAPFVILCNEAALIDSKPEIVNLAKQNAIPVIEIGPSNEIKDLKNIQALKKVLSNLSN